MLVLQPTSLVSLIVSFLYLDFLMLHFVKSECIAPDLTPDLLVSARDVVEDGVSGAARARLVEDVERLERLELVLLVHVVLRHDLLKLCARHVHAAPPARTRCTRSSERVQQASVYNMQQRVCTTCSNKAVKNV